MCIKCWQNTTEADMAKAKEKQDRFYELKTEDGVVQAVSYFFRGTEYIQTEISTEQAFALGDLLVALDVPGVVDFMSLAHIKIGELIGALVKNRAIPKVLSVLLTRKDGAECTEDEFRKGKAIEMVQLVKQVAEDFFTFNPELSITIRDWLAKIVFGGVALGQVLRSGHSLTLQRMEGLQTGE